ncbi:(2Fe-2S)-binding protein [Burkholderia sp. ABCPW 14]|uniref:2Fe-2S iron-sulfur cluster-binding protein n=1 Tax=Burkholderia sp. ABCPW 14 TaxID=1637860 RepID=UPI000770C193|nr:2Fe-2S iron-sulfur cluster-binding protein [Burkholderia sp. ABCPW 14]KVD84630.1 (2Fe-2S)-binding protein [Burkholderia sp. ABCPW 14]
MTESEERSHRVRVEPLGVGFDAPESLSLLEAAGFAGVSLPRSCRNGTCRTCLCRLREGSIVYRIDWPGVSAEEKAEGYILPCVAIAQSDLVIEAPDAE